MNFLKMMLIGSALASTCTLGATQDKETKPVSEPVCEGTIYMGYEASGHFYSTPLVGYRYQYDKYIVDVNAGYVYKRFGAYSAHCEKGALNIYTQLLPSEKGQLYGGIGVAVTNIYIKEYGRDGRNTTFSPTVSLGHDFKIENNKKMFVELTYAPYIWERHTDSSLHSIDVRVGFGF